MYKVLPKDAKVERDKAMPRMRMLEAMSQYGLDGRAYEYDIEEDCVIVWATDFSTAPRILARICP
jgi:hypothetical protein